MDPVCVCVCVQISDAVYSLVQAQCLSQYEQLFQRCEAARSSLEASIRTDMDQIITSKEHVTSKIRGGSHTTGLHQKRLSFSVLRPEASSGSTRSWFWQGLPNVR